MTFNPLDRGRYMYPPEEPKRSAVTDAKLQLHLDCTLRLAAERNWLDPLRVTPETQAKKERIYQEEQSLKIHVMPRTEYGFRNISFFAHDFRRPREHVSPGIQSGIELVQFIPLQKGGLTLGLTLLTDTKYQRFGSASVRLAYDNGGSCPEIEARLYPNAKELESIKHGDILKPIYDEISLQNAGLFGDHIVFGSFIPDDPKSLKSQDLIDTIAQFLIV